MTYRSVTLYISIAVFTTILGEAPLMGQEPQPPVAKIISHTLTAHGDERVDNYYWLNDRENADVVAYLTKENEYTKAVMKPYEAAVDQIFEETKARIKQDDSSVPYDDRGYTYYTRFEEGQQYPLHCRKKVGDDTEQLMLDVNALAEGHSFCSARGVTVSPDNTLLAYATDFQGRRIYTMRFKNLADGSLLPDTIENVTGNLCWAEDNKTVFYTRQDPQTLRWYQVFRHTLGDDPENDVLVYEETDDTFSSYVRKSRSRKYILIQSEQTLSSEFRYLPADQPTGEFQIFQPREADHEYSINHLGDHFYIRTNWNAKNFCIMQTAEGDTGKSNWKPFVPHQANVLNEGIDLFNEYVVVEERRDGLTRIRILPCQDGVLATESGHELDFGEPTYSAGTQPTPDPDTEWLRYGYTSMTTPFSVYQYDLRTRDKELLKETEVLGDFSKDDYKTERLWVTARDGVKIPVSLVYHKDTQLDGTAPCLLYGYGSYGSSIDASFNSPRLNLVDRGFVFAIAHIRGGQEMGRHWYEDGKLLKKVNTFTDFVDAGIHLVENKYADPQRLYARGGSAGGLLIGAAVNLRPDLFHGVVADVPFVDVVTTMLDDSIPLTTSEYDEWGDPNDPTFYKYMLAYSPYDNVEPVDYPHMLVTTGLHDSQVQYWEPAKWVAKLRVIKSGDNLLLLKTNMDAGHGGASGRFDRFKEVAFRHAFLLRLAGVSPNSLTPAGTETSSSE